MKPLVIYGAGGVGRAILQFVDDINDIAPTWAVQGFIDDRSDLHKQIINGVPVLGGAEWFSSQHEAVHVVIAVADCQIRGSLVEMLADQAHVSLPTIVHPKAWIASSARLERGCIVYPGVLVDPDVSIGTGTILNKAVTVGHDTVIQDCVTIAPGVNVGGNVHLGGRCNVGMGASIIQQVQIGASTVIGAGAVVVKDLPTQVTAVGVPAQVIKHHKK